MGGLFEVIIIERRASQRAETLGNKPAQPSDYQMEISQRKPTLAGEDRAQADGPRKTPQAARQLTVPRADSLWGRVSDWCGSLNSSISLPAKFSPPGCLCYCCCLLTARFHSPVSQSVGDRQQAGAEEPHHITLVSLSPATSTGLRPTPTPTTREARRPPWRIGCSRPTSQPAEPRWRPVVVSYVVGLLTNSLTVGQAGGRGREIARSIVALPLGSSVPGWDGWTTSFYRYFIYLLTAYDRSSNFFLGVARSEAMVLVPGQWASSGAEGRGGTRPARGANLHLRDETWGERIFDGTDMSPSSFCAGRSCLGGCAFGWLGQQIRIGSPVPYIALLCPALVAASARPCGERVGHGWTTASVIRRSSKLVCFLYR